MNVNWTRTLFTSRADHTALGSFTSEASLLAGTNQQPVFPAFFWDGPQAVGKAVLIEAAGVVASAGTPTYIFQARLGTTQGSSDLTGTSVGVSVAITTGSGVTDQYWKLSLLLTCYTPGQGTNNTTLTCAGSVKSPGGFASPFEYALEPTTPPTATWTATINAALTQYLNLSVTCSASSASNAIRLKQLTLLELN